MQNMKSYIKRAFIFFGCLLINAICYGQEDSTEAYYADEEYNDEHVNKSNKKHAWRSASVYLTIGAVPVATNDFYDFDVSDWQRYGLRIADPGSLEGRVRLPLGQTNPNGYKPNLSLGMNIPIHYSFDFPIDMQYASADNFYSYSFSIGLGYHIVQRKNFQLTMLGHIGYVGAAVDFGEVQLIDGYIAPVIIDQGTFTNGDSIQATMSGVIARIGLRPVIALGKNLSLVLDGGYCLGLLSNTTVEVNNGITLNMNDPALVYPDGYNYQAGLNPSVQMRGIYFQAGIQINLSGWGASYDYEPHRQVWE